MPERNQGDMIRSERSILGTPDQGRKGHAISFSKMY